MHSVEFADLKGTLEEYADAWKNMNSSQFFEKVYNHIINKGAEPLTEEQEDELYELHKAHRTQP